MFAYDLSIVNISVAAIIAFILASYTLFLLKLKPAEEHRHISNRNLGKKTRNEVKQKTSTKQTTSHKTKKTIDEEAASDVENNEIQEDSVENIQTEGQIEARLRVLAEEIQKKKNNEAKKSFFLFGKKDFEGCVHKFGYLRTLPKNTPIPDECFGCSQILECLMREKNK